ncbi:dehydrogenase [Mycobacterium marinum M]|uniref:Dehydrogenase n=2 Tax=Mycobacterium marinum TaxID=1781 RepID=B2HPR3_MYCMM|nr:dehydrogenase [Mycobacterium marinum M]
MAGLTALITGATSGIGRATAHGLAELGATVLVSGRDEARGREVVDEVTARGGRGIFLAAELRDVTGVRNLATAAADAGAGKVDILINSAGAFPFGPTADTSPDDFDAVFALNVRAPYFLVGALAPTMAKRGRGSIVNVTTMVAEFGAAGTGLYGASKAAIALLTKSWAAEYGPSGVRVNAVSPGPTRTEGTVEMGEALDQLAAAAPAGRPADPTEIASTIVYLASDAASFIHGAVVPVDGGRAAV